MMLEIPARTKLLPRLRTDKQYQGSHNKN